VNDHEQTVRTVCAMWADGKDAVKESWRKHASEDIIWWNSARGALRGRVACEAGIDAMFDLLEVVRVEVPIRNITSSNGLVFVERSDDLYLADGTCLAAIPVVGVVAFVGDTIAEWRDYCDDWMRDYRPSSERALA
jgi:limonene-1,2-epoxide hydrolase